MKTKILILLLVLSLFNCKKENRQDTRFQFLTEDYTGIDFQNKITENDSINIMKYEYLYNGGGVGVGDFNNDKQQDLIFTGNMQPSRLYLNKGDLQFEDATKDSQINTNGKWITGVSVVDINQDGYDDIYLNVGGMGNTSSFPNLLYINNGDATFTEAAGDYGIADPGESIQALFFDYDLDGDLDMYLLTGGGFEKSAIQIRPMLTESQSRNTDRLYRNDFDSDKEHAVFTDVSKDAGITIEGFGLGVAVIDANNDQWPDLYISNDYLSRDLLYVNNQDGTFSEKSLNYFGHMSHFSMGNDVSDVNNDGLMDLITLDMLPEDLNKRKLMSGANSYSLFQHALNFGYGHQHMRNMLHLNNGNNSFSEIGQLAGVDKTNWSWSALFADLNNNGKNDLYITNGFGKDITDLDFVKFREKNNSTFSSSENLEQSVIKSLDDRPAISVSNYAYKNQGNFNFQNITEDWGFQKKSISNGAVYVDLDMDGDLELVVNNIDQPAFIYKNLSREQDSLASNYLQIKLEGEIGNLSGIGTSIEVQSGNEIQVKYQQPFRGFQSTVSKIVHFGLAEHSQIDRIKVTWPDQKITELEAVTSNQLLTITQNQSSTKSQPEVETKPLLVKDSLIGHEHEERPYNDYATQPLLTHNFSNQGPSLAVGDINNDGLQDVFVGGAYGSKSYIYKQTKKGDFMKIELLGTEIFEDTAALFFDANGDGWQDLYVSSGGSERYDGHLGYRDRLYINEKGSFIEGELPEILSSTSTVAGGDFDKDGDIDLFVGGRVAVGNYPEAPSSYILENRNGTFHDVTAKINPELRNIGMVTSAVWTDFDNDNHLDLVLTGEYMPIMFFKGVENNTLKNVTAGVGMANSNGLWRSLSVADLDNDGDMDFVAGNLGQNSQLTASTERPLQLHYADFDENGSIDPVLSKFEEGDYFPVASLDQLSQQLSKIKKKFLYYNTYATTTTLKLLEVINQKDYQTLEAKELKSSWIENLGDGTFKIRPLPIQAQFAPINAIYVEDLNHDGFLDMLLVGNDYNTEVVHGRYDASIGTLLVNQQNGNFEEMPRSESGFSVFGDAKSLVRIDLRDGSSAFLTGINNAKIQSFRWETPFMKAYAEEEELSALISFSDGTQRKVEFNFGNETYSQSSKNVIITLKINFVSFYDRFGKITRKLKFNENKKEL